MVNVKDVDGPLQAFLFFLMVYELLCSSGGGFIANLDILLDHQLAYSILVLLNG
jgi:hypothetical protein